MTLQQLRYALAVGSYHSINEAAAALFVTQPTISTALKELEEELNVRIFTRCSRGIEITSEGIEFLGFARQVIEQANLLKDHYIRDRRHMMRFVVSTQHYSFVVQSFIRLVKTYGMNKYHFCIRETRTNDIIKDVHNMSADIGIIFLSSSNSAVIKRILRDEELDFCQLATTKAHVFVSVNNPLATRSMVSLADVADLPFLCFEQGVFSADYFEEEVLKNNHGTKTIRVSDRATLFNLLIGLNGYTISSGIICKDLNPEIVSIPLQSDAYMEIGYIRRKNVVLSPLVDTYVSYLRNSLAEEGALISRDSK